MRFYPRVPTRRVGGRKGLRLAISDLVTVSVEPGGKHVPIDALPVAARRVLHHEASGDHERVDMPSLQASDDPAGAYSHAKVAKRGTKANTFAPCRHSDLASYVKPTHSHEHVNVVLC